MPAKKAAAPLGDDDVAEILTRVPARSLLRFRCVSKSWLALTSAPFFARAHASRAPVSGFFLSGFHPSAEHFPFDHHGSADRTVLPDQDLSFLSSLHGGDAIRLDGSCNGLVLCHRYASRQLLLYVHNPLTRDCDVVTVPSSMRCFNLAFDPTRSSHYKVVGLGAGAGSGCMSVYSSKTKSWSRLQDPLLHGFKAFTWRSFFLNGDLIWVGADGSLIALDVERERLRRLPCSLPEGKWLCLGGSRGRLHVLWSSEALPDHYITKFDVLEMASDCSGWSLLHRVDLGQVRDLHRELNPALSEEQIAELGSIVSKVFFMKGGNGGGDELLLSVGGKIVSYHLLDKKFAVVCSPKQGVAMNAYSWFQFYPHVHSLLSLP